MYYLKDLSLIGCGFISKKIVKKRFGQTFLQGDFILNGKLYPAEVIHFRDGRPAMLTDVLGESKEEAYHNLCTVVSYVESCIANNTNGIGSAIRRRLALSILRLITTTIVFFIFGSSIHKFVSIGYSVDGLAILAMMFLLCIVLLFVNRKTRSY